MQVLVGVDIGTTNIKANAFTLKGEEVYRINKKNKIIEHKGKEDFDITYIKNIILDL